MQDLGELDFCCSEEKYFLSTATVTNYLDISLNQMKPANPLISVMVDEKSKNTLCTVVLESQ